MPNLIIGLVALYLLLAAIKQFGRLDPATVARIARRGGGAAGLLGVLTFLLRGRLGLASALITAMAAFFGLGRQGGASRFSTASSATVEMTLDRASGAMTGKIIAGDLAGRDLASLDRSELMALYGRLRSDDRDGASLLEAYFDRRFAGWRETDERQGEGRRRSGGGAMTREEAYETLGLAQGASGEEIIRAHRALMKKIHPDHGGSTALAARVNQAKDVLLQGHG